MSATETKGDWLVAWDPEDESKWDKKLAWNTLTVSTFTLTLCFVAWFLPSAIVPKLNALGFEFTKAQLYWLAAMPGLSGGILRLVWMVLPPKIGTRKLVTLTTLLLILPVLGWGFEVTNPDVPYWRLMGLSFLGSQTMAIAGKDPVVVWYQNSALVYIPFIIVGAIWAYIVLKSVPVKASIKQQFDIFSNQDTWWMTILYIMTFGTFSGLSAQFGLLMVNLYGSGNPDIVEGTGATATLLVEGYSVPDPVKFVFLGPLIGAGARVAFSPLTDRMGGAVWTLVSGIGILGAILYTIPGLTPDTSSAAALQGGFNQFLWGMLAIFLFSGIGNASTFKQMPMIFERRQAGGVIGWTGAIAAFGPFLFGVGLTMMSPTAFYTIGAVWAVMCIAITWWRYARPGAPKKS